MQPLPLYDITVTYSVVELEYKTIDSHTLKSLMQKAEHYKCASVHEHIDIDILVKKCGFKHLLASNVIHQYE